MANNCFFEFTIEFKNSEDKEFVFEHLSELKRKAKENNEGMYLGSEERYLFDCDIYDNTNESVLIFGWVKWCFNDKDIVNIYKQIDKLCSIKKFNLLYQELSCLIYGEYSFDKSIDATCIKSKILTEKFLSNKFINHEYDNYDDDIHYLQNDLYQYGNLYLVELKNYQ